MAAGRPRMPAGLGPAGKRLWRAVTTAYELEDHEGELLALAAEQADIAARLQAQVESEGLTVRGASGQQRAHPGLTEARLARLAVAQIVKAMKLPPAPAGEAEEAPPVRESPTTKKARHAAEVRWRRTKGGAA